MAILWVQEYIHNFSGDPDNVIFYGTSIGAGSILLHTIAYDGQPSAAEVPNWHAGIATSVAIPSVYEVGELRSQHEQFLDAAGCESLQYLRGLSSEEFQAANNYRPATARGGRQRGLVSLWPSRRRFTSWRHTISSARLWDFSTDKPLIIGSRHSEGTLFAPQANSTKDANVFLKAQYPLITDADLEVAHDLYSSIPQTYPRVQFP